MYIPIHLVFYILSRLPIKSLLRFKSVCKSWRDLIENPEFIETHHTRSQKNPNPTFTSLLVTNYDSKSRMYNMQLHFTDKTDGSNPNPNSNPNYPFENYFHIVGICDGLVCVTFFNSDINICNPTTGDLGELPRFSLPKIDSDIVFTGFGLLNNEYTVLRLVYSASENNDDLVYSASENDDDLVYSASKNDDDVVRAEVYSMTTRIWREIEVKKGAIDTCERLKSYAYSYSSHVAIDGVFYWIAYSCIRHNVPCVVHFDMNSYIFGVIACPYEFKKPYKRRWQLVNLKGELALASIFHCKKLEVWVFNERDRVWTMKLRADDLPMVDLNTFVPRMIILGCEGNDNLVMQNDLPDSEIKMFSYDLKSHEIVYLPFGGIKQNDVNRLTFVYFYTDSLLSV